MSGIAGLWNLDGRPAEPAALSGMSAALSHRGPDGEGHWLEGPVALSCRHRWTTPEDVGITQPLAGPSGTRLVMDGRLDNRDELIAALSLPADTSDAGCALAAYEAWNDQFAERLNGDFALAIFDARRQRLLLARDALGVRPLYFRHDRRLFAFASEIKALLAHPDVPARPDDEGLADYLLVAARGVDRQHVTCFAGISAVVPAHLVVATAERVATRRYWDFDTASPLRLAGFDDYVAAFRERFETAVARRARAARAAAVWVSGGLDSSSIYCQAHTLRRSGRITTPELPGISYVGAPGSAADEQRYLDDIERACGTTIRRIAIEPLLGVSRGAEDQVRAIEGPFLDYQWGVTRASHQAAREAGATVLLSGHWGDQMLFCSAYLADVLLRFDLRGVRDHMRTWARYFGREETAALRRELVVDVVRHIAPRPIAPLLKWLRRRISRPDRPAPWLGDAFRHRALARADRPVWLGDRFHSIHARALYLEARSKYHVHCMEWNNKAAALHGLDMAFPYLDRDLVQLLISVPGDIANRHGVPRALLREAMRGVLPEPLRERTWKADFSAVVNAGVSRDLGDLTSALGAGSLAVRMGYLDEGRLAAALPRLAAELQGPECLATWDLTDLFGLETWLQVFFGSSRERADHPARRKEGVA